MAEKLTWEKIVRRWKHGWVLLKQCEVQGDEVVAATVVAHSAMQHDLHVGLGRLKDPTAGIFPVQKKRPKPAAPPAAAR